MKGKDTNRKVFELLYRSLDGDLKDKDQKKLDEALKKSEELRIEKEKALAKAQEIIEKKEKEVELLKKALEKT